MKENLKNRLVDQSDNSNFALAMNDKKTITVYTFLKDGLLGKLTIFFLSLA